MIHDSDGRGCLREIVGPAVTCDECQVVCPFYTNEPENGRVLFAAELEQLTKEMDLKNIVRSFVFFIK